MGYNTTMIVLNDALDQIRNDKEFGKKVYEASLMVTNRGKQDISSGGHCNAATVIECHHADHMKLIAVGGNCGQDLGYVGGYRSEPLDMLKALASELGYNLVKKPKKRSLK